MPILLEVFFQLLKEETFLHLSLVFVADGAEEPGAILLVVFLGESTSMIFQIPNAFVLIVSSYYHHHHQKNLDVLIIITTITSREENLAGIKNDNRAQSSLIEFCKGVPVIKSLFFVLNSRSESCN